MDTRPRVTGAAKPSIGTSFRSLVVLLVGGYLTGGFAYLGADMGGVLGWLAGVAPHRVARWLAGVVPHRFARWLAGVAPHRVARWLAGVVPHRFARWLSGLWLHRFAG